MPVTGAFPYDVNNLLGGAVRVLRAPISQAIPDSIDDVITMTGPTYAPKAGWVDFGATREGFTYSRGFDTEGYEIQQAPGAILEEITDVTRTLTVSVAELTDETLALLEEGAAADAVAAVAGASAQERVRFGTFASTTPYRIAFIARRHRASGTVTEPGGATRGRFVMGVGYNCQITADDVDMDIAKGELTAVGLSFRMFPEAGQANGQEHGAWFLESAGTISAT